MMHPESGTKILLEHDGYYLAYQRDNNPDIPYPNMWDFIGGGVEPGEMQLPPEEALLACAERELKEELGLIGVRLHMLDIIESQKTPGRLLGRAFGRLSNEDISNIQFGSEGQLYDFFRVEKLLLLDLVPQLKNYVRERQQLDYLDWRGPLNK